MRLCVGSEAGVALLHYSRFEGSGRLSFIGRGLFREQRLEPVEMP
jgi:hypothetical protein